jgi:hypothetical protein
MYNFVCKSSRQLSRPTYPSNHSLFEALDDYQTLEKELSRVLLNYKSEDVASETFQVADLNKSDNTCLWNTKKSWNTQTRYT